MRGADQGTRDTGSCSNYILRARPWRVYGLLTHTPGDRGIITSVRAFPAKCTALFSRNRERQRESERERGSGRESRPAEGENQQCSPPPPFHPSFARSLSRSNRSIHDAHNFRRSHDYFPDAERANSRHGHLL